MHVSREFTCTTDQRELAGRAEVARRKRKEREREKDRGERERERDASDYRIGKRDTVVGRFRQGCWQGEPGL